MWHLHQDLVISLGLLREGDKWICPDEDYTNVAKLSRRAAVFHVSRTDVDLGVDVPEFGPETDENVSSRSWEFGQRGRKLYDIRGEWWRNEWINPGEYSPRIRRDKIPGSVSKVSADDAHIMMSSLFIAYELRLADAHQAPGGSFHSFRLYPSGRRRISKIFPPTRLKEFRTAVRRSGNRKNISSITGS